MARLSAIAGIAAIGFGLGVALAPAVHAQESAGEPADEAAEAAESARAADTATDLTLPPRFTGEPLPGDARLEPAAEEREDMLEAVVTRGQTEFRLPDLGTSFRDDEEESDPNARIEVSFLNLYDPENRDPAEEAFPSLEEQLGHGMLRVFRVRFGDPDRN